MTAVSNDRVTLPVLRQMKADSVKIVGVVAWDTPTAAIADRAGVDLISVGDTVGVHLWGHATPLEVTMDEMVLVARAVRRGVRRALVSCDFPFGPLQSGPDAAIAAALRLVKEAGVDVVKLDGAIDFPECVTAIERAGIPVIAQFGITPQTALRQGVAYESAAEAQIPPEMIAGMVDEARSLERAGASMLNFTNSGLAAGTAVAAAVAIPVLGGFGGGPWLDGRIRLMHAAVGAAASTLDRKALDAYAAVARVEFDAISTYAEDVRSGRQIKGGVAG
ncbi:3-methyl-2-oxobutanoate hydroxymethyltransferase [Glaciihabitans sp. UYNi722]|uniref:3-methyl-2-oxobutanoate hydroxymethyltransferase n=1 Tax=Glaciihabitans sp. UYNi722 TaxID=3156344 RepID=UPI003397CF22